MPLWNSGDHVGRQWGSGTDRKYSINTVQGSQSPPPFRVLLPGKRSSTLHNKQVSTIPFKAIFVKMSLLMKCFRPWNQNYSKWEDAKGRKTILPWDFFPVFRTPLAVKQFFGNYKLDSISTVTLQMINMHLQSTKNIQSCLTLNKQVYSTSA